MQYILYLTCESSTAWHWQIWHSNIYIFKIFSFFFLLSLLRSKAVHIFFFFPLASGGTPDGSFYFPSVGRWLSSPLALLYAWLRAVLTVPFQLHSHPSQPRNGLINSIMVEVHTSVGRVHLNGDRTRSTQHVGLGVERPANSFTHSTQTRLSEPPLRTSSQSRLSDAQCLCVCFFGGVRPL